MRDKRVTKGFREWPPNMAARATSVSESPFGTYAGQRQSDGYAVTGGSLHNECYIRELIGNPIGVRSEVIM